MSSLGIAAVQTLLITIAIKITNFKSINAHCQRFQMIASYRKKKLPSNSGIHRWLTAREEWYPLTNEDKEEESYCWVKMSNNELLFKMYQQLQKFSVKEWLSCEYKLLVNGRKESSWHLWTCIKHLVLAIGIPNLSWHTVNSDTMDFRWQVIWWNKKTSGWEGVRDVFGFWSIMCSCVEIKENNQKFIKFTGNWTVLPRQKTRWNPLRLYLLCYNYKPFGCKSLMLIYIFLGTSPTSRKSSKEIEKYWVWEKSNGLVWVWLHFKRAQGRRGAKNTAVWVMSLSALEEEGMNNSGEKWIVKRESSVKNRDRK